MHGQNHIKNTDSLQASICVGNTFPSKYYYLHVIRITS